MHIFVFIFLPFLKSWAWTILREQFCSVYLVKVGETHVHVWGVRYHRFWASTMPRTTCFYILRFEQEVLIRDLRNCRFCWKTSFGRFHSRELRHFFAKASFVIINAFRLKQIDCVWNDTEHKWICPRTLLWLPYLGKCVKGINFSAT